MVRSSTSVPLSPVREDESSERTALLAAKEDSHNNQKTPEQRPSRYLEKIATAPPDYLSNIAKYERRYEPVKWKPVYYFFYGSLMDPEVLAKTLGIPAKNPPILRPACIIGYELVNWSKYPTLLGGQCGHVVEGYAYEVQSEEDEEKLAYYETKAYEETTCRIRLTDLDPPEIVRGKTFKYAGDEDALRERRFDRKLWIKIMGLDQWPQRPAAGTLRTDSGYSSLSENAERQLRHMNRDVGARDAAREAAWEVESSESRPESSTDATIENGLGHTTEQTMATDDEPQVQKPRILSRIRRLSKKLLSPISFRT